MKSLQGQCTYIYIYIYIYAQTTNTPKLFLLLNYSTERKKWSHFTYKVESLEELKLDTGFRLIGEHLSQIDSILSQFKN